MDNKDKVKKQWKTIAGKLDRTETGATYKGDLPAVAGSIFLPIFTIDEIGNQTEHVQQKNNDNVDADRFDATLVDGNMSSDDGRFDATLVDGNISSDEAGRFDATLIDGNIDIEKAREIGETLSQAPADAPAAQENDAEQFGATLDDPQIDLEQLRKIGETMSQTSDAPADQVTSQPEEQTGKFDATLDDPQIDLEQLRKIGETMSQTSDAPADQATSQPEEQTGKFDATLDDPQIDLEQLRKIGETMSQTSDAPADQDTSQPGEQTGKFDATLDDPQIDLEQLRKIGETMSQTSDAPADAPEKMSDTLNRGDTNRHDATLDDAALDLDQLRKIGETMSQSPDAPGDAPNDQNISNTLLKDDSGRCDVTLVGGQMNVTSQEDLRKIAETIDTSHHDAPISRDASTIDIDNYAVEDTYDRPPALSTMPKEMQHPQFRKRLAKYKIEREIACGGMGAIFQAQQTNLHRKIAIKKLLETTQMAGHRDKFISESLVTASLDHPNIVPVYDIGENESGEVILAMKLVGGIAWDELLVPKKASQKEIAAKYDFIGHLEILINVCNAIAFAHSKNIAHCDLKPANVMVGEFGEVLVMDWGIAVDFGENIAGAYTLHKSQVNAPMGTPNYMAPELAEGKGENIGPWTDVYLLGAILYELITGKPPHTGQDLWAVLQSVLYKTSFEYPDDTPEELQAICNKSLAQLPQNRYQTILELQQDVQSYLEHRESIIISDKAYQKFRECREMDQKKEKLKESERNLVYGNFAEALAGFTQALELWAENKSAAKGKGETRFAYAEFALKNLDIGLAEAQIAQLEPEQKQTEKLRKRVEKLKEDQLRAQKMMRRLRYGLLSAVAIIILGLTTGMLLVRKEQKQTEKQKIRAEENEKIARKNETLANKNAEEVARQKTVKAQEARKARIRLAQIALSKADEAIDNKAWAECGMFSGEVLELIKGLENVMPLQEKGKELAFLALEKHPIVWKTVNRYNRNLYHFSYSPDNKLLTTAANDKFVRVWDSESGRQIKKLKGHDNFVLHVAFHPGGQWLASGSRDKTIIIWDWKHRKTLSRLVGHSDEVNCVEFSPGGSLLASASSDSTVKIWDWKKGQIIKELQGHDFAVTSLAFSPDGKWLASASKDETIVIWQTSTGKKLFTLSGHKHYVNTIVFHPEGKMLASGSVDNTIILWETISGKIIKQWKTHDGETADSKAINAIAFNKGGKLLSCGSQEGKLQLWDVQTGKLLQTFVGHQSAVQHVYFNKKNQLISSSSDYSIKKWNIKTGQEMLQSFDGYDSLTFSPHGKWFAAGSTNNNAVKLWNTSDGTQISQIKASGPVNSLVFDHTGSSLAITTPKAIEIIQTKDGKILRSFQGKNLKFACFNPNSQLIAGADGNNILLWSNKTGKKIKIFKGHEKKITHMSFHPNRAALVSASEDQTIRLWSLRKGKIGQLQGDTQGISWVNFTPDGKQIVFADEKTLKIWSIVTKKIVGNLTGHKQKITEVCFSRDGQIAITASLDTTIRVWDLNRKEQISIFEGHGSPIDAIVLHPDGKMLASASLTGRTLRMWDLALPHQTKIMWGHDDWGNALALAPHGDQLATGTFSGTIYLWAKATGKKILSISAHDDAITCLAYNPQGKILASGSLDKKIKLWNAETGELIQEFAGHEEEVTCLFFSKNGTTLYSSSFDGSIRSWDKEGKSQVFLQHSQAIKSFAFGPQEKLLAFGATDNTVRLWQMHPRKQLNTLSGHQGIIHSVSFCPDGKILASASQDKTVKLWKVSTGALIKTLHGHTDEVHHLAFSCDGKKLASAGDKTVRLWDARTGTLSNILTGHTNNVKQVAFHVDNNTLATISWDKTARLWHIGEQKHLQDHTDTSRAGYHHQTAKKKLEHDLENSPREITQELFEKNVNENFAVTHHYSTLHLWAEEPANQSMQPHHYYKAKFEKHSEDLKASADLEKRRKLLLQCADYHKHFGQKDEAAEYYLEAVENSNFAQACNILESAADDHDIMHNMILKVMVSKKEFVKTALANALNAYLWHGYLQGKNKHLTKEAAIFLASFDRPDYFDTLAVISAYDNNWKKAEQFAAKAHEITKERVALLKKKKKPGQVENYLKKKHLEE